MADLKMHTTIHSRYQVFDASGGLPFSIVFGLCRHSSADTDPRPLKLSTKHSVYDVPHALANGLLELCEEVKNGDVLRLNLSDLTSRNDEGGEFVTLPSPVGRTDNWRNAFTTFLYEIEPGTDLASRLQVGKTYTFRLNSQDLGVKWWAYGDSQDPEPLKLLNQKSSAGKATFKVVPSLSWPPRLETHLRMQSVSSDGETCVAVSATNTGSQPITAQTRGLQRFLLPSTPFQDGDDEISDYRASLIDTASEHSSPSALQIIDLDSGRVVYQMPKPTSAPLTQGHDPRPKRQNLVTLKPRETVVREVNVSSMLTRVPDGRYGVRMAPRGLWWCEGAMEDVVEQDGDRVRREKWNTTIPPLVLESEDIVEIEVRSGRSVEASS
ncbi:hypothetical protein DOTSEDRAFT_173622 [Dothistroma septosporum NZE10]|uniref:Uncharacterized protein n=1 Tax=Dothistroma septosporum (strain NZE10 / CBS 128990) TaxID=675120 RepID=M2Y409_DOTSN|nr:hypothetical protein DOTSEDRAFT_173622 [Dothistroma septosporum NZE10]